MKSTEFRTALWFTALVVLLSWMVLGWTRDPPGDRIAIHETPFDRTPGLNSDYWRFLQQVGQVLPRGATFTIRAETAETEMQLFMLSQSVVGERQAIPTTYYGVPNPGADEVKWIASYRCAVVPAGATVVSTLPDGCICLRKK